VALSRFTTDTAEVLDRTALLKQFAIKMHILFLTDNFPPEVNAPASRTFEHCREWVKAGHQVTVVTCAPNFPKGEVYPGYRNKFRQSERMDGIRVIRVWTYITANQGFVKRILDYQSFMVMAILTSPFVRRVDLVIGTSPQFFTVCAAYIVSRFKRIPFVFELRDLWPESIEAVGAMRNSLAIRFLEKLELFLYRKAACVIAVTHSFRRNLVARGIEPEKIRVITNGVDSSRFHPQPKDSDLVARLNLDGKFVAGYIGTHGMAHGLETILEAADLLRQQPGGDAFRFIFLGDGACKSTLREKAKAMGLSNVIFIDSVPKEEVVKYWSLLDVSIIHLKRTDLFTKVIPSKLFECMGMGIPVLHGVAGESAEIVESEGVGLVFEPENARQLCEGLRAVQGDRIRYETMQAHCLKAAPKYGRTELARQMLSVLGEVSVPTVPLDGRTGPASSTSRNGMRLLFINRYFHPDISATAQLLTELAEDLAARGETVTVITGNTPYFGKNERFPALGMHNGIRIVRVGFARFDRSRNFGRLADYLSFSISALWAAVRTKDQDCVIVLSDPPLLSLLAAAVQIIKPVKTICWVHDVFPDNAIHAGILHEGLIGRLFSRIVRWSLHRMSQVVVIGRCMEDHLCRAGVSKSRIAVIPNWADGSQIKSIRRMDNQFIKMQGLEGRFVVMYSGNFGIAHEIETILSLVHETRDLPQLCFCFIGEGAHKQRLLDAARRERWEHVRVLPYQPKETLQQSLSAADIHLVSLRANMAGLSVPSKIYGIMAAGRPMIFIGPEESEIATLIRESQCGFVVRPGDPQAAADVVMKCYRDRNLCEQKGLAAREYFDRYGDRPRATAQFRQVIQKVAA
jgi:glycosyltransferase involved in cell wall biosynthesis